MNVYKDGRDNIALHQDKESQWVPGTGFATVAFGVARPFQIEHNDTKEKQRILHTKGPVSYTHLTLPTIYSV